jgi:hypothetical protein
VFFKAVRAGLAVKHPYLSHTGRASNAEKQPTSPAQRVAMKMGVAIKMGRRLGKRVSVLAYGRMGVWRSKTAFRHGYYDREVSTKFMTLWKRRYADSPIRRHVSPSRRLSEDVKGGQRRRGLRLWFRPGGSLPKVSFDAPRFQDIAFAPQILVRWLSGRKRRFAKALYLKRVPRVRIPASPVNLYQASMEPLMCRVAFQFALSHN